MNSETSVDLASDFEYAIGTLLHGLRNLHQPKSQKIEFSALVRNVQARLGEPDLATDLVEQYMGDQVASNKLGHFIETALAFTLQAEHLHDHGDRLAWVHLCRGYFMGGMAVMQYNLARGPQLRIEPFKDLKRTMLALVESKCPPEKWGSREEIWRAIEDEVLKDNDGRRGKAGFSKDPKAMFVKLARENGAYFESFLRRPVKRGRPPKSGQRG